MSDAELIHVVLGIATNRACSRVSRCSNRTKASTKRRHHSSKTAGSPVNEVLTFFGSPDPGAG